MNSLIRATPFSGRLTALSFAAAVAALSPAQADQSLPASAQAVRTTLIAMSAADAVTPLATAAASASEAATVLPVALKPDTANAMAAVRTASVRREPIVVVERRVTYRPYRDPFFLAVGVAY